MNIGMKSLHKNKIWELVNLLLGKKPLGYRWIYMIKYKIDGTIKLFKSRFVVKSYSKTYGINSTKTFILVANKNIF